VDIFGSAVFAFSLPFAVAAPAPWFGTETRDGFGDELNQRRPRPWFRRPGNGQ
jgi:hypothetical protein